jgi:hypothetical protein
MQALDRQNPRCYCTVSANASPAFVQGRQWVGMTLRTYVIRCSRRAFCHAHSAALQCFVRLQFTCIKAYLVALVNLRSSLKVVRVEMYATKQVQPYRFAFLKMLRGLIDCMTRSRVYISGRVFIALACKSGGVIRRLDTVGEAFSVKSISPTSQQDGRHDEIVGGRVPWNCGLRTSGT